MRRVRQSFLRAGATAVVGVLLTSCTGMPRQGTARPAAISAETSVVPGDPPVTIPAVTVPTTATCAVLKLGATCHEWSALNPVPSFHDLLRLEWNVPAPEGIAWGAWYICGALPGGILAEFLGAGLLRYLFGGRTCGLAAARENNVRLGLPTLELALVHQPLDTRASELGTPITMVGDRPVVRKESASPDLIKVELNVSVPGDNYRVIWVLLRVHGPMEPRTRDLTENDARMVTQFVNTVTATLINVTA